jgi:hypothetical protein
LLSHGILDGLKHGYPIPYPVQPNAVPPRRQAAGAFLMPPRIIGGLRPWRHSEEPLRGFDPDRQATWHRF